MPDSSSSPSSQFSTSRWSDAGNAVFSTPGPISVRQPRSEAELREALREASRQGTPVTITAALTGLTGAAVPVTAGVRLDMAAFRELPDREGWRRVTPFLLLSESDPHAVRVAPGVSIAELNAALDGLGLWYPPPPGEWRALIGGNVATNASGPRAFAFGTTRDFVEALRVVLAEGDVLDLRRGRERVTRVTKGRFTVSTESGRTLAGKVPDYAMPVVKNAAGLFTAPEMDLIDLFIGSEGILGAFSEIGIRLVPRPFLCSELLFFDSTEAALDAVDALRPLKAKPSADDAGEGIVSLEFFDAGALQLAREAGQPVPENAHAAVEVEIIGRRGTAEASDRNGEAGGILRSIPSVGGLCGTLSGDAVEAFRYAVPRRVAEILKERGQPKLGTDFAVPVAHFREMCRAYEAAARDFGAGKGRAGTAAPSAPRTATWGHAGDCHLHMNFLCDDADDLARARALYLGLVRKAVSLGGTISAEHGVGKKVLADEDGVARPYLWYLYGDDGFRQIAEVKRTFDPQGLLNAGNMVLAG